MVVKQSKASSSGQKNPKKESAFKALALLVGDMGYVVRRESLKQGLGWRVVSGSCRAENSKIIFVDRRLTPDDQISFLLSKINAIGLTFDCEQLARLPEEVLAHPYFTQPSVASQ